MKYLCEKLNNYDIPSQTSNIKSQNDKKNEKIMIKSINWELWHTNSKLVEIMR